MRITTAGSFTYFPLPAASNADTGAIVAGPDGALWFTEPFASKIGRITTAGAITEFPLPTPPGGTPLGIALGPDGALWFTEGPNANIGRITTTGSFTEFPLLASSTGASGITLGPDGALWFTEGYKIGRINMSGAVTEFALPAGSGDITTGPDGALWFTEPGAFKIGRITVAGGVTEYAVPSGRNITVQFGTLIPSCEPSGIVTGPNGALWFAEGSADCTNLGRITVAGSVTEFTLFDSVNRATAGPDRALWFTMNDSIGRADLGLPVPSTVPALSAWAMASLAILLAASGAYRAATVRERGPDGLE